jgi:hypothetical protein
VVAARVGGLVTAVRDGETGLLITGHDPRDWATGMASLLDDGARLRSMQAAAVNHAAAFGWESTVERTLAVYRAAIRDHQWRLRAMVTTLPGPLDPSAVSSSAGTGTAGGALRRGASRADLGTLAVAP